MSNFKFGKRSMTALGTCHPGLQLIADEALAVSPYDFTIIHGWRDMKTQNEMYFAGNSRKQYPNSRHNKTSDPQAVHVEGMSDALDFAPFVNGKINWFDTHIFAVIAGCFMASANRAGHTLRWGGDWNSDGRTYDQTLMDYGHLELMWRT